MTEKKKWRTVVEPTEEKQGSYHPAGSIISNTESDYAASQGHDVEEIHVKSFLSVIDRKIRYFM